MSRWTNVALLAFLAIGPLAGSDEHGSAAGVAPDAARAALKAGNERYAKGKGSDPASAAFVSEAVKENVRLQLRNVTQRSELLKKLVAEGKVAADGAVYDLKSGKVEWLEASGAEARPVEPGQQISK